MDSATISELERRAHNRIPADRVLAREPMSRHTSFQIGGPCDLLIKIASTDELKYVLGLCREVNETPFFMGNGSNLLVRDGGIRQVVIKIESAFSGADVSGNIITAQAGILLPQLAKIALNAGLTGLEFASGIPGTLGGALRMNAGAYGGEIKDTVLSVTVMDMSGNTSVVSAGEMEFGYRTSALAGGGLIALSAVLALKAGDTKEIHAHMRELAQRRREKQPLSLPSAGSAFKRPEGHFAGQLIQQAGMKGYSVGGAQISPMHAGFIVNNGGATAHDVEELIARVQKAVYDTCGVTLSPEIRIVGETA